MLVTHRLCFAERIEWDNTVALIELAVTLAGSCPILVLDKQRLPPQRQRENKATHPYVADLGSDVLITPSVIQGLIDGQAFAAVTK